MIIIDNCSYRYGMADTPTLNHLSLTLDRGEIGVLVGRSGCGKSSLLFTLNGIIPHHFPGDLSGDILVGGVAVTDQPVHTNAQRVGIVFQNPETQFCTLTVADEVAFGLENLQRPRADLHTAVDQALAMVGLQEKINAPLTSLSGGQQQKVALAAVLAMDPDVLLFDKPVDSLDPVSARDFYLLLHRISEESSKTILIVEPDLGRVINLADRVFLMDTSGTIVIDSTPAELEHNDNDRQQLVDNGVWLPPTWEKSVDISKIDRRTTINAISVHHLSYSYADHDNSPPALDDLSFTIPQGSITAIVGQNGAGKTTLLKHLVGIFKLKESDQLSINGRIGFVFQNPEHQFMTYAVRDELAYGLSVSNEEIVEVATQFDLSTLLDENPFSLSHGQKRLLSIATAVIADPDILVLDEPTVGLDRVAIIDLMNKLINLNKAGKTIIFITHDMRLVDLFAHQVIVMANGRIIFDGKSDELFQQANVLQKARLLPPTLSPPCINL